MEADERKKIEQQMLKRALEPIQNMVRGGIVQEEIAMAMFIDQFGHFSDENKTPEFLKFKENSGLIYADEVFFDAGYKMDLVNYYTFNPASGSDVHALFKIYQHLSKKDYDSPEQLKEIIEELFKGKRILELGCGPGFNLKVFKDLGAIVSGVEIRDELIGGIPELDIRHGDAEYLDDIFKDEEFDLIYSKDFFCDVVLEPKKSQRIAAAMSRHTKTGGLGVHSIVYEKLELAIHFFGMWINNNKAGRDEEGWDDWFWNLSEEEREDMLYTNRCSLDPQYLLRSGFQLKEYSVENSDLTIVVEK